MLSSVIIGGMSDYHQERAEALLKNVIYMLVGSASSQGKPWTSPVYFTVDDNLNFYWASDKNAQHSINVRQNPDVFLVIYNSAAPEGKYVGEGLYIEASAVELSDKDEIQAARTITQSRKGVTIGETEHQRFMGDAVRRVYKAVPTRAWVNDVEKDENDNYVRDVRIEVSLDVLKRALA